MAPFLLTEILGKWGAYLVYLAIGFAFGTVLEVAGFGNSRKLAAQFYFRDLTVLKVMFGAIVTAMVLIFFATGVGWLDYNLIYVNPTYLWPGIIGGLIMGVGFIVGGFCPGTSLVAAATAKIDGIFFVLGVLFGIFLFGETVDSYAVFWNSSYMGRFTLMDWLNLPTGVVVLIVVLMALFMFWGGEQLERRFGGKDPARAPRLRYAGAAALAVAAVGVLLVGQPDNTARWERVAAEKETLIQSRAVQIAPGELLSLQADDAIKVVLLDVRSEADYNLFHLRDARHVPLDAVLDEVPALHLEPANAVFVLMSNDEGAATAAWRLLVAESVPNVYLLEEGINGWLALFAEEGVPAEPVAASAEDALAYQFAAAVGERPPAAYPNPHKYELTFTPKVELELKRAPTSGGCG